MYKWCFPCLLLIIGIAGCNGNAKNNAPAGNIHNDSGDFYHDYWYSGKAEISSYRLQQARYGEVHRGHAVLIFVTEDFSANKHVKIDHAPEKGDALIKILKLNQIRKFPTGIYPYSIMTSVFTPVSTSQYSNTLKVTCSVQEWCGQTFTQLNLKEKQYRVNQFSYFEDEGDQQFGVEAAMLEDEIWNRIRINPEGLPRGSLKVIPAMYFIRFKHLPLKPYQAQASLMDDGEQFTYTLTYDELDRSLIINFEKDFPYRIAGWEETYQSGWGQKARKLTTRAELMKTVTIDYWTRNRVADSIWRDSLILPPY